MKINNRYIIFYIIIFLSNLLFSFNVKAMTAKYSFTSDNSIILNTYDMTKEEIKEYTDKYIATDTSVSEIIPDKFIEARNYYLNNYKDDYEYYFISYAIASYDWYIHLIAFNEENIKEGGKAYLYNSSVDKQILTFYINNYNFFQGTKGTAEWDENGFQGSGYSAPYYYGPDFYKYSFSINKSSVFYETNYNFDFYLYDSTDYEIYNTLTYNNITYYKGQKVFNSMDGLGVELKPKIKISLYENNTYSQKIKVNFSIFDLDKYKYEFKITGMEEWNTFSENDYIWESFTNHTFYVRVSNLSTNEIVSTATFQFDGIDETIPNIKFSETIPDNCYIKGKAYCKELRAYFSNYYNSDYFWSVSYDKIEWTILYDENYYDIIDENKTIYFKLFDKYTNEDLRYLTYQVTGIESNFDEIGPYLSMKKISNSNISMTIRTYFYNVDNDLYNYFYSTNGKDWNVIDIKFMIYSGPSYNKYYDLTFYEDTNLYVKVEDKQGNYITSATYQIIIDYDKNVSGLFNNVHDYINEFKEYIKIYTDLFSFLFNSLNPYVQKFIIIILIILIIIGAIKLLRR